MNDSRTDNILECFRLFRIGLYSESELDTALAVYGSDYDEAHRLYNKKHKGGITRCK